MRHRIMLFYRRVTSVTMYFRPFSPVMVVSSQPSSSSNLSKNVQLKKQRSGTFLKNFITFLCCKIILCTWLPLFTVLRRTEQFVKSVMVFFCQTKIAVSEENSQIIQHPAASFLWRRRGQGVYSQTNSGFKTLSFIRNKTQNRKLKRC